MSDVAHATVCAVERVTQDEKEGMDEDADEAGDEEDEQQQFKRWLAHNRGQRDPAEYLSRTISSEHVYPPPP